MAIPNTSDLGQFFDFSDVTMPDAQEEMVENSLAMDAGEGFLTQEDLQNITNPKTDFNTDFSTHLPRYQKPAQSCDSCRLRGLECFIYDADGSGRVRCSPCNALFRPCSFSDTEKMPTRKQKTALDTLAVVGEDVERCFGGPTGKKQMRSLGHLGPIEDDNQAEDRPKKGAAAARFPRAAIKILKDWMLQHIDHPYPTDEEKELLKQQTELTIGQISNWMANNRRRQKARPKRCASPSIRPSTQAMNIPAGRTWESLDPFERWKHSPVQNEPAPLTAITHAIEHFDPPTTTTSASTSYRRDVSNTSTGSFSHFTAPSISSVETGVTGVSSGSIGSHNSAYSYGSRHSLGSMNSLKSKERRRRRRLPTRPPKPDSNDTPRLFQCTFCTDRFKNKYDWSRHEKSLHLSLEKWLCAPLGEIIADKATGKRKCVYCDELEPSEEHLATHNHNTCCEKGPESRTFYRKDHLRQHLRLMHGCKMTTSMDSWKSEAQFIKSRCGFCDMSFNKWQDRIDHLAKEFRSGADMKTWKGCRGLDAHVAIYVTNAMPPYLIADESKSPFPFSASNSSSLKQHAVQLENEDLDFLLPSDLQISPTNEIFVAYSDSRETNRIGPILLSTSKPSATSMPPVGNPNATCWEILTLRLGRYAREHMEKHDLNSLTDEMLQKEARIILYGEADGWEQTAADNPEWLNLFKKAHGIDTAALKAGINHHEVYEDLGIHSNTVLDPSFNVNNFAMPQRFPDSARDLEFQLSGSTRLSGFANQLSSGRQSPHSNLGLSTSVSASPKSLIPTAPITSDDQFDGVYETISELVCSHPGGPCYGENGEAGFAVRTGKCAERKKRYWLNENLSSIASLAMQCSAVGDSVYECVKVGLRSFSPLNEQACPADDFSISALPEKTCTKDGDPTLHTGSFQFPSWDQLPEDLQNPITSADFCSTIPISTTGIENSGDLDLAWDNEEMNFVMDMDMDLDLDLNMVGKC
ncbi:hypothetical protein GQ44DRAFT_672939 [Phaeosphaeriaceae sp. PMI808]|nr:hypothetical protein GQ44DRAFT_672939 [Phaeosphaeriaceae sp. PMI808]